MASASDYSSSSVCYNKKKSNSNELLERSGGSFGGVGGRGRSGNNMGVLNAGAWPMSHHDEPVYYDRVSSGSGGGGGGGVSVSLSSSCSRRSMRVESKDCLNCHHQRQQSQQHLHHQQPNSQHHQNHQYIHHNQSSRHINEIGGGGSGGVRNGRPLSVPPSMRMISSSSIGSMGCGSGTEATHMEMMPLNSTSSYNSNPNPGVVPCRATLNGMQTASPPTCVPWLRKMKVIKKIQRKIGMGNRGGGISPNNLPPLLFNAVHGENVNISQNGSVAKRANSFCKGIVFSDRAVKINEKVCLKFVELSKSWSGVLRFGFTSHDPSSLRSSLPRYACPDLTSKPGFWAKAFSDLYVKKDGVLYFYVNAAGDVYFGINGEEKGLFFSGVDTRGPLWVLIDIYGNTTGIEFVDPRSQLNNSRSDVSVSQPASNPSGSSISSSELNHHGQLAVAVPPPRPSDNTNKVFSAAITKAIGLFPNIVVDVDQFNPITKGPHAIVAGSLAKRLEGEYSNAYVFPNQPLRTGETVVIFIREVDLAFASSMAFGLTSCNPKEISHVGFPEDAYRLLDRPEYWVVEKDVANSPNPGDIIGFTITPDGEVVMRKNDEQPKILMHVDNSVPLFPFFDLYGTTTQIHLVGIVPSTYYRPLPPIPTQVTRCRTELPRSSSMQASSSPYTSLIRNNVPHSVSAVSCSPAKIGASSSHHSAATLAAMSTNEKNNATYATLNKKVSGPSLSPATTPPSRDPPNWSIECVACCERPVDSVFYSCGHMCMCYQCAVEYWKTKEKGCCPICRATINDVIRTYKS